MPSSGFHSPAAVVSGALAALAAAAICLPPAPLGQLLALAAVVVTGWLISSRMAARYSRLEQQLAARTAELEEAGTRLAQLAQVDALTGLLNRRGFIEQADAEIRRVFRTDRTFSLVLVDVDDFRRCNDRFGHVCGDQVLQYAAALLGERARDVDRLARWGGDEFIILLPETDTDGAVALAEQLRDTVASAPFDYRGHSLEITMTFGVSSYRRGEALDNCVARADTALTQGKKRGPSRVMIGSYRGLTLVN
jgi:diguanylate cyclase (GGDEF)-like protein